MTWKEPNSRQGWREMLSAYLDNELEGDERIRVERRLEADPALAEELDAMRRTSRALAEWSVEAPRPGAALKARFGPPISRVRVVARPRRKVAMRRLALQAALFVAGMLTGALAMNAIKADGGLGGSERVADLRDATPAARLAGRPESISPGQADRLLRKTQAENLKREMLSELERDNWRAALAAGKQLWNDYPDAIRIEDLNREDALRLLRGRIDPTQGRI